MDVRKPAKKNCGSSTLETAITCGKRELFSDFEENSREKVKLGDNSSMDVLGKGNVQILVSGFYSS